MAKNNMKALFNKLGKIRRIESKVIDINKVKSNITIIKRRV